ncbi:MAG: cellulase family glycosylhydrolase [Treponema sp.]|nr:cellulase family glycosylhydrolase [Treponema sp.]
MLQKINNLILDNENRTLILRGVNLGGDSKIPFDTPGSEISLDFLDTQKNVSFIGRPFPLEEAQTHFKRLKKAGMTFLRFLITWEAIEHEGPGIYDEAYLAYLRKILLAAEKEGINVFIDPHQDVWSRWTGGDGAPSWTMEKLGMNLDNCDLCDAAITRQRYQVLHNKPYPKMIWPGNYNRYAAATMFSLFFAGNTYAPNLQIDGENIQDYLQNRYISAFRHVQRRLKNCAAIAGWGSMNEPHYGFIGHQNLMQAEDPMLPIGLRVSPWQAICAASGYTVKVPVYSMLSFGKIISKYETFNRQKVSLFKEGFSCPWKQAGIWQEENGTPSLLRENHFSQYQNRPANFADDFLKPFIIKYINAMKEADEKLLFFIEGLPKSTRENSHPSWSKNDPDNVVNAFHWYDGFSLYTKSFRSWFNVDPDTSKIMLGKRKIAEYFTECLAKGIGWTNKKMENMPSLLGEFGLAFDMNSRKAFKSANYSLHEEAISMYYDAVDANLLHSTIWNYTASNTNKYGDGWNDEDLSIFSEGKERAAAGWKRPYPMATAGELIFFNWNKKKKLFSFVFIADDKINAPTVIYLPHETFGSSPKIEISTATGDVIKQEYDCEEQRLLVYNDGYSGEVIITVAV